MSKLVVFDDGMKGIDTKYASMSNVGELIVKELELAGNIQLDTGGVQRGKVIFYDKQNDHEHAEVDGLGEGTNGGSLVFYTKVDGGSVTEKLRINNVGAIGLGATPTYGTSGQVLTSQGAGSAPIWSAPSSEISPLIYQLGNEILGENHHDQFGWSVSISDNGLIVAIGSPAADVNFSKNTLEGTVKIYHYVNYEWSQLGNTIFGEGAGDFSGYSVSISGNGDRVLIGGRHNDGNGSNSGHARVYEYDETNSTWIKLGQDIDGEAQDDEFGWAVSISSDGTTVAISGNYNDGGGSNSGHVRVLRYINSNWVQLGGDIDGENTGDLSGRSVSISSDGNIVAIGAIYNGGDQTGHTRVYEYDDSSWIQLGSDIDGEDPGDRSGQSVSISGDGHTVAIGGYYNDGNGSNSGHTRVLKYNNGSWVQLGSDIDGENAGDLSGFSVSISNDGKRVAIGATYNSQASNAGHVRIYDYNESTFTWVQIDSDIDGAIGGDQSGYSVSLSGDGSTVAIGAIGHHFWYSQYQNGQIRLYKIGNSENVINHLLKDPYARNRSHFIQPTNTHQVGWTYKESVSAYFNSHSAQIRVGSNVVLTHGVYYMKFQITLDPNGNYFWVNMYIREVGATTSLESHGNRYHGYTIFPVAITHVLVIPPGEIKDIEFMVQNQATFGVASNQDCTIEIIKIA
jgi:hypothetical protein